MQRKTKTITGEVKDKRNERPPTIGDGVIYDEETEIRIDTQPETELNILHKLNNIPVLGHVTEFVTVLVFEFLDLLLIPAAKISTTLLSAYRHADVTVETENERLHDVVTTKEVEIGDEIRVEATARDEGPLRTKSWEAVEVTILNRDEKVEELKDEYARGELGDEEFEAELESAVEAN